ncbi:ferrous iron transport protein A [Rhodoferax antarcticus]|nr:ferrous iron transport protein A [Rhodoferax antarcticus]
MAGSGTQVRIVSLKGGAGMDRRMTEMGLNIGAQVRVLQQEGSGLVVMRGESRFALGGGMAHRVMVMAA